MSKWTEIKQFAEEEIKRLETIKEGVFGNMVIEVIDQDITALNQILDIASVKCTNK